MEYYTAQFAKLEMATKSIGTAENRLQHVLTISDSFQNTIAYVLQL